MRHEGREGPEDLAARAFPDNDFHMTLRSLSSSSSFICLLVGCVTITRVQTMLVSSSSCCFSGKGPALLPVTQLESSFKPLSGICDQNPIQFHLWDSVLGRS